MVPITWQRTWHSTGGAGISSPHEHAEPQEGSAFKHRRDAVKLCTGHACNRFCALTGIQPTAAVRTGQHSAAAAAQDRSLTWSASSLSDLSHRGRI